MTELTRGMKQRDYMRAYRAARPELRAKARASARKRYEADPEKARARSNGYRKTNAEQINATNRARYAADPEKQRANGKTWREANPRKLRAKWLRLNYKMTLEQWDTLFAAQDGKCAICGTKEPKGPKNKLNVDHDHSKPTGEGNRGLLCHHCNIGLGKFRDDLQLLKVAASYLEKYK